MRLVHFGVHDLKTKLGDYPVVGCWDPLVRPTRMPRLPTSVLLAYADLDCTELARCPRHERLDCETGLELIFRATMQIVWSNVEARMKEKILTCV